MRPARFLVLLLCLLASGPAARDADAAAPGRTALVFGGGPVGGAYNAFATALALQIGKSAPQLEISVEGTGGSGANLQGLDTGALSFGIVYAGDAHLGREGKLPDDPARRGNVRAVACLYGAPAQLVVRADAGISGLQGLADKRVAVGNQGSGAAVSAQRFFGHLGLWEGMRKQHLGYSAAAEALADGRIDAFWVLVGWPNAAVQEAATRVPVKLLDLGEEAERSGFLAAFPFYARTIIPAGTYPGQTAAMQTFQDSSLWCAHKDVPSDTVYAALKAVFSQKGLEALRAATPTARETALPKALTGVSIPLHPGAARFFKENGMPHPLPVQSSRPAQEPEKKPGAAKKP